MTLLLGFEVPIRTVSGLNVREHWAVRAKRVAAERELLALCFKTTRRRPLVRRVVESGEVLTISLTRRSPGELDDDAVPGSMKGVRDELAAQLGIDDRDKRVRWLYPGQVKGPHAVLVSIEADE